MNIRKGLSCVFAGLLAGFCLGQGTASITVSVDKPSHPISPTFYGLMTEEINHAYDGGLYGELVQNRIFMDRPGAPVHWSQVVSVGARADLSLNQTDSVSGTNLHSSVTLKLEVPKGGRAGIANEGYWGFPVKPNTVYTGSFYAKSDSVLPVEVSLEGEKVFGKAKVTVQPGDWKKYAFKFKTGSLKPTTKASLVLTSSQSGALSLTLVSLFAPTYHGRANGNRPDLMEKLAALNPSFLRLPGGNYLEGNTIPERFEWKETLGDLSQRTGHQGPWGYRSSDGLGLLEFLEWCEDLKMQPVLAIYAGYSLRGDHVEPGKELEPFVQDALDEIEYVTGGIDTKWGAQRIKDGHLKPFPLTYVEVGNEDWFDRSGSYDGRYAQFYDAIKAKYPKLQLIATAPVKSRTPDVMDDHYYRSAAVMARDSNHYDNYSRSGPKIFVGEWASMHGRPTPNMRAALGDAAWLTGLERDSDLVVMESYAPLFVNVNPRAAQWQTNLIGYDALTSFGSPSFYVQSMFGQNAGDTVLPVSIESKGVDPAPASLSGAVGVGTWRTDSQYAGVEVTVNGKTIPLPYANSTDFGWTLGRGNWKYDVDGLRQMDVRGEDTQAVVGDKRWTDYTLHLKARKLGGSEGFLVVFHWRDDQNYLQWNIGGWGNTRSALQIHEDGDTQEVGQPTDTRIEPNRWYDIKVELKGGMIRCFLDDQLIQTYSETDAYRAAQSLYSTASRDTKTGDIILKVVNLSGMSYATKLLFEGAPTLHQIGTAWELTGDPEATNSVANPTKVAPVKKLIAGVRPEFSYLFSAHSVTVIRLKRGRD